MDSVLYGLRTERIGAGDAVLIDEHSSHKKRAERVWSSFDALWGRDSDMPHKELIPHSSSDSQSDEQLVNALLSPGYQGAAGVTVTGPDAENIHVIGGGCDE